MEYIIKDMYEQGNIIRIIIEHAYGTDTLGFNIESKKLDVDTDMPKYFAEINRFLIKKYGDNTRKQVQLMEHIGKKFIVDGINPGIHAWFDELVAVKGIGKVNAGLISNVYKSKDNLVAAIKNKDKLSFDKNINDILLKIYGVQ